MSGRARQDGGGASPGDRAPKDGGCACGGGRPYAQCCGRWHAGEPAPDAQALMRSRYSAYVLGLDRYIQETWHPSTRPPLRDDADGADGARTRWLGLEVRRAPPPVLDAQGVERASVEFVARYRVDGRGHRLHETSRFVREGGRWYYVDGDLRQ